METGLPNGAVIPDLVNSWHHAYGRDLQWSRGNPVRNAMALVRSCWPLPRQEIDNLASALHAQYAQ